MAALTKAEMAEALFDQLGLNKREARELVDLFFEEIRAALPQANKSSCPASAISTSATRIGDRDATRRPAKRFPSAPAVWLHSVPAKN